MNSNNQSTLSRPLDLKAGDPIPNRLVKAAMTEAYAISPDEMCKSAKEVDALQKG